MKHYEALGVEKDATPDEIKRAYRKKAKTMHPDKGGNDAEFQPIVQAYEVLKDPERRRQYDETGDDKQAKSLEMEVQHVLLMHFNLAIQSPIDIPIIETVRKQIKDGVERKVPNRLKELVEIRAGLEKKRARVTASGGENLIHGLIDQQLRRIEAETASLEEEKLLGEACLAELEFYSEHWKESKPKDDPFADYFRASFTRGPFDGYRDPFR